MDRLNRPFAVLAGLIVLAFGAAACESGTGFEEVEPGADPTAADEASPATEDEDAPAGEAALQVMTWSSGPAEDASLQAVLDTYNEQTGSDVRLNIVPEYETALRAALASNQPPAAFYVDSSMLPDLVETDALAMGEGIISEPDDFFPALVNTFTYDGSFWCAPKDWSTLSLQYNARMFDEAGVEPPTTWDELRAAAEALTTDDRPGLVLAPIYERWGAFMFQAGAWVLNEDYSEMTIDTPEMRQALEFLEELYHNGWAATPGELDAGWAGEAFGLERAAMTMEGNWLAAEMAAQFPDVEWVQVPLPDGPAGPGTFGYSVCWGVPANHPDQEAAWELVNYLVSPDALLQWTGDFPTIPSRPSVIDSWLEANPEVAASIEDADHATPLQFGPGFREVWDALNDGIQGIAAGNRDIEDVISVVDEAGRQALDR